MDGTSRARRERWMQRAEAAYQRMFEGKSAEELVGQATLPRSWRDHGVPLTLTPAHA